MAWLDDNPPARSQFRRPRRARPSGVIVVHTAESVVDTVGPDTGAENVADFIRRRSDPGSYHVLVDADSMLNLVGFDAEAYQDGTGSNPHAVGISAALRTTDWRTMSPIKRAAFIDNLGRAAASAARWVKASTGVTIPARRITRAQSDQRVPGFISHGERDPGRRSDPGADFPWDDFLRAYARHTGGSPAPTPDPEDDMPTLDDIRLAAREKVVTVSIDPSPIPGAIFVADFDTLTLTHMSDPGDYGLFQRMLADAGIEHRHYHAQAGDDFSGWRVVAHGQAATPTAVALDGDQIAAIGRVVADSILAGVLRAAVGTPEIVRAPPSA